MKLILTSDGLVLDLYTLFWYVLTTGLTCVAAAAVLLVFGVWTDVDFSVGCLLWIIDYQRLTLASLAYRWLRCVIGLGWCLWILRFWLTYLLNLIAAGWVIQNDDRLLLLGTCVVQIRRFYRHVIDPDRHISGSFLLIRLSIIRVHRWMIWPTDLLRRLVQLLNKRLRLLDFLLRAHFLALLRTTVWCLFLYHDATFMILDFYLVGKGYVFALAGVRGGLHGCAELANWGWWTQTFVCCVGIQFLMRLILISIILLYHVLIWVEWFRQILIRIEIWGTALIILRVPAFMEVDIVILHVEGHYWPILLE